MSAEENKTLVRRFFDEVFSKGDLAVANEMLTADFVSYGPAAGVHGPENFIQFTGMLRTALDVRFTVEVVIADGDKVSSLSIMSGTHRGEFRGIAPSRKQIALPRIDNFQISEGKIREQRATLDHQALMQQLSS
jgi:predicted ester cyclase